ncbi:hypothetical protein MAJ_03382, partial [Metarhizium majus ARSEF 297]
MARRRLDPVEMEPDEPRLVPGRLLVAPEPHLLRSLADERGASPHPQGQEQAPGEEHPRRVVARRGIVGVVLVPAEPPRPEASQDDDAGLQHEPVERDQRNHPQLGPLDANVERQVGRRRHLATARLVVGAEDGPPAALPVHGLVRVADVVLEYLEPLAPAAEGTAGRHGHQLQEIGLPPEDARNAALVEQLAHVAARRGAQLSLHGRLALLRPPVKARRDGCPQTRMTDTTAVMMPSGPMAKVK